MATILERVEHESGWGRWTLVRARPAPELRGDAIEYQGYRERRPAAVLRREAPVPVVPVILVLGAAFSMAEAGGGWRRLGRSFVAGLHERSVLVGSGGDAHCLQVDLTPPGARRLFGLDLGLLRDRVVELEDLIGAEAGRLEDRLTGAPGWTARFALLDAWLGARLGPAAPPPPEIAAAWRALRRSSGAAPVAELARRAGLSRQAFAVRFEREIGLGPKRAARLLRLERALAMLGDRGVPLAEAAAGCGYYDQAHFNRDVRAFCGQTPRELRARLLPDGSGLMAGTETGPGAAFVQDGAAARLQDSGGGKPRKET